MTNTGEAESDESTQSKQEWYLLTEQLSALAPAIILLEEANNDGKNSRSLEQLKQNWMTFVSSSLKSKKPVRDLIIRNKVYALSQIHKHKPPYPDEAYRKHFKNKYFYIEFKFLQEHLHLPESEFKAQYEEGNNRELGNYLEAISAYYCDRLLNLADGSNRECLSIDHWTGRDILELTAKLEERKKFDEFYLARTAMVNIFSVYLSDFLSSDKEKRDSWFAQANKMLMEFYNVHLHQTSTANVHGFDGLLAEHSANPINTNRLTGSQLLSKVILLSETDKATIIKACGYVACKDSNEHFLAGEFYKALLSAMSDVGEEDLKHKLSCAADLKPQVTLEPIAEEIRQCTYFRNLSEESIDVLNYFGVDAPSTLNLYSCALEDVFIAQLRKLRILEKQLAEIAADKLDGTSDSINLSALQQKISIVQAQGLSKSSEAISDEIRQCVYFKHLSQDSIDVLDQFGLEAPAKLNEYTCGLEDILIELVQQLNHLENKTKEHLQSGATDISDYNLSLDDDIIAFSTACGPILRRAATAMIGVETYSTSDQEFFDKNYDRWTRAYLRLGGTTHGCSAINIAKYSAICYFALCGPAQISIDERLRYFNEFWNGLEFKLLGTDDPQELSDAVNDRLLAKTTNYNRCVSFKAANVLRTMFFDEWKGTKWLEDSEGRARFEKDFKYVAEQLVFLQENNVSTLHTAFIVSLSFSVSMSIHADECPTRDIYLWACKQLEYIQSTFNGQKAEGWSVDLGYDF